MEAQQGKRRRASHRPGTPGRCRGIVVRCAAILSLVFIASGLPAAEYANPTGVAVIIGNGSYQHRDVPEVAYAHRDAAAFRLYVEELLGYDPNNIVELRDATRYDLFDVFGTPHEQNSYLWSMLDPSEGSDVVVYYSGHGVPGVNDGRGYLLPVNVDPKAAEADGYPIDLLYEQLGGLTEARSVRVYLDACFSGGSHAGALVGSASPVFVEAAMPAGVSEKVTALAAASGRQVASWDEEARHGLFTHHLLDALYGAGDVDGDGTVTASEAKGYLDRHMTRAARRQHRRVQNASLMGARQVVLATAPEDGGTFPPRPALDGEEAALAEKTEAEVESPPSPETREKEEVLSTAVEVSTDTVRGDPETIEIALGLDRARRVEVQRGLAALGFDPGPADGLFAGGTRAAIASWQKAKGLPETGYLNAVQVGVLAAQGAESAETAPSEVSPPESAQKAPKAIEHAIGLTRAQRVQVQHGLAALGFGPGPADGVFGRRTRAAIAAWQKAKRLPETGFLNAMQAETLAVLGEERERAETETRQHDNEAFARAKRRGTMAAYEEYLESWPTGHHADEARRRRDELSQARRAGEKFRDCRECPEMVVVPPGSFRMGAPPHEKGRRYDEGPLHQVTIVKPFAVGVHEVTFSQWDACARAGGCNRYSPSSNDWGRGSRPVINVNWEDAQAYVRWLSHRTGRSYRLPSEAEWEYAARAGTRTPFHFGATIGTHQANYDGTRAYGSGRRGQFRKRTLPVGTFAPNRFGLHDVHGNVQEWVQDCWNISYTGAPGDGGASKQGNCSYRMMRGGSWDSWPSNVRSAKRRSFAGGSRSSRNGFRVARTLTP